MEIYGPGGMQYGMLMPRKDGSFVVVRISREPLLSISGKVSDGWLHSPDESLRLNVAESEKGSEVGMVEIRAGNLEVSVQPRADALLVLASVLAVLLLYRSPNCAEPALPGDAGAGPQTSLPEY